MPRAPGIVIDAAWVEAPRRVDVDDPSWTPSEDEDGTWRQDIEIVLELTLPWQIQDPVVLALGTFVDDRWPPPDVRALLVALLAAWDALPGPAGGPGPAEKTPMGVGASLCARPVLFVILLSSGRSPCTPSPR